MRRGCARPKTSFGVFALEKTHLIATNLLYLTFLRHIFSRIHIITKHKTFTYVYICPFCTPKTVVQIFFFNPFGLEASQPPNFWLRLWRINIIAGESHVP